MIQLGQIHQAIPISSQYRHTSFLRGYEHENSNNDHSEKFEKLLPRNSLSLYSSELPPRSTPSPDDTTDTMAAASTTDATSIKGQSRSPEAKSITVKDNIGETTREGQDRLPGIAHLDRQMLTPWSSNENRFSQQERYPNRIVNHDWNFDSRYNDVRRRPSSPIWNERISQGSPSKIQVNDEYKNQYVSPRTKSPFEGTFPNEESNRQYIDQPRTQYSTQRGAYGQSAYERSPLPPLSDRAMRVRERSPPIRQGLDSYRFQHGRGSDFSAETYSPHRTFPHLPRTSAPSLRSLSMPFHNDRHAEDLNSIGNYYDDSRRASPAMHSSPRHHPYAMQGHIPESPPNIPRRRGKLPKPVTDLLKTWLLDHAAHPYPTEDEKRRLCAATGLSISQVSNWFINARRRILVPQGSGHFGVSGANQGNINPSMHQHHHHRQSDPRLSPTMSMHDRNHHSRMLMESSHHGIPRHYDDRYASNSHYGGPSELITRSADHSPR